MEIVRALDRIYLLKLSQQFQNLDVVELTKTVVGVVIVPGVGTGVVDAVVVKATVVGVVTVPGVGTRVVVVAGVVVNLPQVANLESTHLLMTESNSHPLGHWPPY